MGASGFDKAPPLMGGTIAGVVTSVDLDMEDCTVKIGSGQADGVTWYGDPPKVGEVVLLTHTGSRLIISAGGGSSIGGGGGTGGSGGVEQVNAGLGLTISGTIARPVLSANKAELGEWFPDKAATEDGLSVLDARVDALQHSLLFAGIYDASTNQIASVSAAAAAGWPLPPPAGYSVGANFLQVPSAAWNNTHFFIVGEEGLISAAVAKGITQLPTSAATGVTHLRTGDWVVSNGSVWVHLTYSSRMLLARSIVVEGAAGSTWATQNTVQKALDWLLNNKLNRTGPDTFNGNLTVQTDTGLRIRNSAGQSALLKAHASVGQFALRLEDGGTPQLTPLAIGLPRTGEDAARWDQVAAMRGEYAVHISDWNSAVENGITYMAAGAANAPFGDGNWYIGRCLSHNPAWKIQELYQFTNGSLPAGTRVVRTLLNGVWTGWRIANSVSVSGPHVISDSAWEAVPVYGPNWGNYSRGIWCHARPGSGLIKLTVAGHLHIQAPKNNSATIRAIVSAGWSDGAPVSIHNSAWINSPRFTVSRETVTGYTGFLCQGWLWNNPNAHLYFTVAANAVYVNGAEVESWRFRPTRFTAEYHLDTGDPVGATAGAWWS
jgi:hypothetical protein